MRILHLLNHTRRLNGHVHAMLDLACAQVDAGHSVAVCSGAGDFDGVLARNGVERLLVEQHRRPVTLMMALHRINAFTRHWKADVVHAHMTTSALLGWTAAKLNGIPLVTTVHNEFERASILMGVGTRVIAVSDAVARSLHHRGISSRRLDIVLNGTIGSKRFASRSQVPLPLERPAIVFVGGLHPRKGVDDLLKAFDILHAAHPAVHLYIVGGGPCYAGYEAIARSLPSAAAIHMTGPLDDPYPFLLGADICVLPSHADPAPLVLSEAREAGCAVVASDVDGIPELLDHGQAGLLVPLRNPARLAEVLASLVQDPDALRSWRAKSQSNISNLTIQRVATQTIAIYEASMAR